MSSASVIPVLLVCVDGEAYAPRSLASGTEKVSSLDRCAPCLCLTLPRFFLPTVCHEVWVTNCPFCRTTSGKEYTKWIICCAKFHPDTAHLAWNKLVGFSLG